ncbi:SMC-Scp complex subunit ScpB [Pelobium manganitolerans]|uniref:SMC-Scp complex subunit ScpB n=1 Tax=Pelobium manganitolerans TaxID=1842495 RepID=A0A419S4S7_9SPHI|nr:SMC-Scp complex subunit ScpB [Pelobium manganitolerans]RKD14515.1 SMC-Scp complex subunit ScpB [Pelobium manganitolerans]
MLVQYIEALIFASDASLRFEEILICLHGALEQDFTDAEVKEAIAQIKHRYNEQNSALELVEIAGGYQFLTRKSMQSVVNQLHIQKSKKKLSQSALETLAIIAYRQPITKLEIEQIRGVNCDYTMQKLLEKDLISISGKADGPGRPLLYRLSQYFLDYFGIASIADLPQLKDVEDSNQIEIGNKID